MNTSEQQLLQRQSDLQAEAEAVAADLGLDAGLSPLGRPVRVGSAALGLLVRRDLDITVVCPALDEATAASVARLGARLIGHPQVRQVTQRDDTGRWNTDPNYPDGLYLGVRYRSPAGADWTLDIWFVDEPDRQPDLQLVASAADQLTEARRVAILTIKSAWAGDPGYGSVVHGIDIYRAVVDDDVRTVEQFDDWRARHRSGEVEVPMDEPCDEGGEAPCYAHLLDEGGDTEREADDVAPATVPDDEGE